jgi:RHS repeat-associated protein
VVALARNPNESGDANLETRLYPLQNWRADLVRGVVCVGRLSGGAFTLIEAITYDTYGNALSRPPSPPVCADIDNDGSVNGTDVEAFFVAFEAGNPEGDIDLDGSVTGADAEAFYPAFEAGISGPSQGAGAYSGVLTGYSGYVRDRFAVGGDLYHVRHRVYDTRMGRWTTRDPLGYVDGMGLYEYVSSAAVTAVDPSGLSSCSSKIIREHCEECCSSLVSPNGGMGPVRMYDSCMETCETLPFRHSVKCVRCWKPNGDFRMTCCVNDNLNAGNSVCSTANDYPAPATPGQGNQLSVCPDPYGTNGPLEPGTYYIHQHPMGRMWRSRCEGDPGVVSDSPWTPDTITTTRGTSRNGILFHPQINYSNGCITIVDMEFIRALRDALIAARDGYLEFELVDAGPCP